MVETVIGLPDVEMDCVEEKPQRVLTPGPALRKEESVASLGSILTLWVAHS